MWLELQFFDDGRAGSQLGLTALKTTKPNVNTRRNCALNRRSILSLYAPEFQRQTLNFVGTIKEIERTKEEQRERPCCGIRLHFPKSTVCITTNLETIRGPV